MKLCMSPLDLAGREQLSSLQQDTFSTGCLMVLLLHLFKEYEPFLEWGKRILTRESPVLGGGRALNTARISSPKQASLAQSSFSRGQQP